MEMAAKVVGRMGFSDDDIRVVTAMIQHHLLLPETATRRDLSDPRTATNVAEAVGDLATLELLHALTEADSRATGPAAWSTWKKSLIDQLVGATAQIIQHGPSVAAAPSLSADLTRLAALAASDGGVRVEHVVGGDIEVVRIVSSDRSGLFARIAAVLALHSLDVVGAQAVTGSDGVAVDEFRIARVAGVEPDWKRIENDLRGALSGEVDVDVRLEQRLKSQSRRRRPMSATPARLEVLVSNEASDYTTVVEVRAPDAPVVLYRVARALSLSGLDIRSAVVATLGHEVVDVFYVTRPASPNGQLRPDEFAEVRDAVRAALA